MPNLSSLSGITTAATSLSNLILVSPQSTIGYQPNNPPNSNSLLGFLSQTPPAILFHYEGEQSVSIESDITDHYIEDNTAIQDQVALRPEIISTHGYIGELNDIPPAALALIKAAADKLTVISAYTPELSVSAQLAYASAFQLYQVGSNAVNSAISAWSSLAGTGGTSVINGTTIDISSNQNKQQVAFQTFYGYWRKRTLFTVQTPWAVFQNCAIYKLRAIQGEETDVITDFEVTFKLIRIASTISSSIPISAGRLASQAAPVTSNGTSTPSPSVSTGSATSSSYSGVSR